MTQWNGFDLSLSDKLRSRWNAAFFWLRNRVGYRRGNYQENIAPGSEPTEWSSRLSPAELNRTQKYESLLGETAAVLSLPSQQRTWATLDLLAAIPNKIWLQWKSTLPTQEPLLMDAGCQDFSRAPAIQAFIRNLGLVPHLTGIELDAYGMLGSIHSRADRADFFARISGNARFQVGDFFSLDPTHRYNTIFCFYPFVSPHPALAWGLPYEFGDAGKWIRAIERNLAKNGLAVMVHQGAWEEEEFRNALIKAESSLRIAFSAELQEVFEPHPHPTRLGVYSSEA